MPMNDPENRAAALDARRRQQARHDRLAGPVIAALRAQDLAWREIARVLGAAGIPTPRGGSEWHPELVKRVSARGPSSRRSSLPVRETNLQFELAGVL